MSKIKEINILTTDKSWWRLMVDGISATKDETIANVILAQTSVSAGRIWGDSIECIDNPVCINTANIIAIEVIREARNDMKTLEEIKKDMKFGDIYTTDEFIEDVNLGYFNEFDGIGYFHDGEKETEISCWNEQEANKYPYVCWYNK